MIDFPRFRYLLATNTREHGSPISDISIQHDGAHILASVLPARIVAIPEFQALSAGLIRFHETFLERDHCVAERRSDGTIFYQIAFTEEEILWLLLTDSIFLDRILLERHRIVEASFEFFQEISKTESTYDAETIRRWHRLTAEMLSVSIPFLLVDEKIIKQAEMILHRHLSADKVWKILASQLRSPYALDVAQGLFSPLPPNKEWTTPAPPWSAPIEYHPVSHPAELPGIAGDLNLTRFDLQITKIFATIHQASEETHYVLGTLLLAGNHIFSCNYL